MSASMDLALAPVEKDFGQDLAKAVARKLVETTRHPIEVVARENGFGDRERMHQAFLRAFGHSPQAIQRASGDRELV